MVHFVRRGLVPLYSPSSLLMVLSVVLELVLVFALDMQTALGDDVGLAVGVVFAAVTKGLDLFDLLLLRFERLVLVLVLVLVLIPLRAKTNADAVRRSDNDDDGRLIVSERQRIMLLLLLLVMPLLLSNKNVNKWKSRGVVLSVKRNPDDRCCCLDEFVVIVINDRWM